MSNAGGTLVAALFLLHGAAAAQEQRPSYYPEKPRDGKAVYLVKDGFPVHADGVGDDSIALQRAIDQVRGAGAQNPRPGGGIVFVPEGRYRLSQTVYVWRGIRLIGYGRRKPVFVLAKNTPGYQSGAGRYMIYFASQPGEPGQPVVDGNEGTLYSGLSNIDIEIQDGNPAAIAVRAHFAQHSALAHVDFRIGAALGAVEEIGHEVEDCRFFGGEFAIRTAVTAAGWQSLVLDSEFVGQRSVAIETHEAGMTVIRCRFRGLPYGIRIPVVRASHLTGESTDKLYVKDSRFEDIQRAALWVARYYDPKTQVNVDDVECARTPVFLEFNPFVGGLSRIPEDRLKVAGVAAVYAIRSLSHGLRVDVTGSSEPARKRDTVVEGVPLSSMTPIPAKDFPELPPQSSWVNVTDLGAKGDGKADDTAAFRKAIAEHQAVYVPQGSYRISDTLTLGPGTALIGLQPSETRLILLPSTPGFTDISQPKPVILAPRGSAPIVSGIGILLQNANEGAVGVKWMAGAGSYMDDVTINTSRTRTGAEEFRGFWIAEGGGGTFKGIWTPSESATAGLVITDTSTPGAMYQMSVEHHRKVEIVLKNVSNWTFYTIQTEEVGGDEATASMEMEGCRRLKFVNYFMYHNSGTNTPFQHGIRTVNSGGIVFRGVHNFSGGPFPFDHTLLDADSGALVAYPEVAALRVR
ncbi:MAG TPA: glycosyl hydrolase family 28-related protein [Bryobacteraceae bacterium]|nr:glycosyl hydrolase family 28-related protein [Bryobacteraceae bacterium]